MDTIPLWMSGNEDGGGQTIKKGSKKQQTEHVSYTKAKTLLRSCFNKAWWERHGVEVGRDDMEHLTGRQQVALCRLRTGHCRLLGHLHRLKVSFTDECPGGTSIQTPEYMVWCCIVSRELSRVMKPRCTVFTATTRSKSTCHSKHAMSKLSTENKIYFLLLRSP